MYETWKGRWKVWTRGGAARPPLLLLHGFTGDGESFRPVVDLLGVGRTVVALTLPGHEPASRRSGLSHSEPEFELVVDRLAADVQRIVPPPYHLLGYSMGARVGLALLVRHPQLFSQATLVSVHPGLDSAAERKKRAAEDRRWIAELEGEGGLEAFVDAWERRPLFSTQDELPIGARTAQRALRSSHTAEGLAWALRVLGLAAQPSLWDALFDLDVPLDLVTGDHDAKFTRIAERMVTLLPRAAHWRVPGAGHNVVLERPDVIADLIGDKELSWHESGTPSSATRTSATRRAKASQRSRSTGRKSGTHSAR